MCSFTEINVKNMGTHYKNDHLDGAAVVNHSFDEPQEAFAPSVNTVPSQQLSTDTDWSFCSQTISTSNNSNLDSMQPAELSAQFTSTAVTLLESSASPVLLHRGAGALEVRSSPDTSSMHEVLSTSEVGLTPEVLSIPEVLATPEIALTPGTLSNKFREISGPQMPIPTFVFPSPLSQSRPVTAITPSRTPLSPKKGSCFNTPLLPRRYSPQLYEKENHPILSMSGTLPISTSGRRSNLSTEVQEESGSKEEDSQSNPEGPRGRPLRAAAQTSRPYDEIVNTYYGMDAEGDEPMVIDNEDDMDIRPDQVTPLIVNDNEDLRYVMDEEIQVALTSAHMTYMPLDPCGLLVCMVCERAVSPKTSLGHVKDHDLRLSKEERACIGKWCQDLLAANKLACKSSDIDYDILDSVPGGRAPFPYITTVTGLGCPQCNFSSKSDEVIRKHWAEAHRKPGMVVPEVWERRRQVYMQTFFHDNIRWIRVRPAMAGRKNDDPYFLYMKDIAPAVAQGQIIGPPPANNTEVPVFLQVTRWHDHLGPYMTNKSSILQLVALMSPPTGRNANTSYLGMPLRRTVKAWVDTTISEGLDAPLTIRKLLRSDKQYKMGTNEPWVPVTKYTTRLRYTKCIYDIAFAILSSLYDKNLQYSLPLTEEDRIHAEKLKSALVLDIENGDTDQIVEDENISESREASGEEILTEASGDPEDIMDSEETHSRDLEDDDLANFVEEEGLDQEIEEEDLSTFRTVTDDNSTSFTSSGNHTPSYVGLRIDTDGGRVDAFHKFMKPFLYPRGQSNVNDANYKKWGNPIECLLALRHLKPGGGFQDAQDTTGTFAIIHHHIRGATLYEGLRKVKTGEFKGTVYEAVENEFAQSIRSKKISPYSICADYQRIATILAKNPSNPPTTHVSDDFMTISYREHTLHIAAWREGLRRLSEEAEKDICDLCYHSDFNLEIPDRIPDDWANTDRGYSWTKNGAFLPDDHALLDKMLHDVELKLSKIIRRDGVTDKLWINKVAMKRVLEKCDALNMKIALLALLTSGLFMRISQFLEHKYTNTDRPRTVFLSFLTLWLVIRRSKVESVIMKETFTPTKCHPGLTKLIQKYLLIVRPLEIQLAYHVYGPDSVRQYREYLWMTNGERTPPKRMYSEVENFLGTYCNAPGMGVREYRQICVEIGRIFLGSEADIQKDRSDLIDLQMGHTSHVADVYYAREDDQLPRITSSLLRRYSAISEAWWEVTGFAPGRPPLAPLALRRQEERQLIPVVKKGLDSTREALGNVQKQLVDQKKEFDQNLNELKEEYRKREATLIAVFGTYLEKISQQVLDQQVQYNSAIRAVHDDFKKRDERLFAEVLQIRQANPAKTSG